MLYGKVIKGKPYVKLARTIWISLSLYSNMRNGIDDETEWEEAVE